MRISSTAAARQAGAQRLLREKSPYLLDHAANPVDWYPWGPEALQRAREEKKPILLSIGYSACHWCHVMARESFEDAETASLMNSYFINVKVDREERPDLDLIYQRAVQAMGIPGGWPLTVFLTPKGHPFFGGTYFPPEEGRGRPSFRTVLKTVHEIFLKQPTVVENNSRYIRDAIDRTAGTPGPGTDPGPETLIRGAAALISQFDPVHGGFGHCPKFPQPLALSFLLRRYQATGEPWYRNAVELALTAMARGGIYDHLGGGFHRYSTDERWLVPHFEKMLYDNALLVPLYLDAYTATGVELFKKTALGTLEFMGRELLNPRGGFYASLDADSRGAEGAYYLWTHDEIVEALGPEAAAVFCASYGVTRQGTVEEGRNVLHAPGTAGIDPIFTEAPAQGPAALLEEARRTLLARREKRPRPARDEKVITAWNGLAVSAYARAAEVLDSVGFRHVAEETVEYLLSRCFRNGRLLRYCKDDEGRQEGFVEDYAFLVKGLLDLWCAGADQRYLDLAVILTEKMNDLFWNDEGEYYLTSSDHAPLIRRPPSLEDQIIPSGTGIGALNLLTLAAVTGHSEYRDMARKILHRVRAPMEETPLACTSLLAALDFDVRGPVEIVILGRDADITTHTMIRSVYQTYLPNRVLVTSYRDGIDGVPAGLRDLLSGKKRIRGRPTAFVCRDTACSAPVADGAALKALLTSPAHQAAP